MRFPGLSLSYAVTCYIRRSFIDTRCSLHIKYGRFLGLCFVCIDTLCTSTWVHVGCCRCIRTVVFAIPHFFCSNPSLLLPNGHICLMWSERASVHPSCHPRVTLVLSLSVVCSLSLKFIAVQNHNGVHPRRIRFWSGSINKVLGCTKSIKSMGSRSKYNNRWTPTKPGGNPLGRTLLHRLMSNHDCLLVDENICDAG